MSRVSIDEYFTRHYHANSKPMGCLIQLNKVFEMWIRSLSMHPDIWNKLMSMHLKSYVNASRLEILFRSRHQTDAGIFQNQPSWTLPLLLLAKLRYQLNQSMNIMWDIRRVVLVAACVVHPEECIDICQCILDSYPCGIVFMFRLSFIRLLFDGVSYLCLCEAAIVFFFNKLVKLVKLGKRSMSKDPDCHWTQKTCFYSLSSERQGGNFKYVILQYILMIEIKWNCAYEY